MADKKLSTFVMEALIEDFYCWPKKKRWLQILSFMFHTTGQYPMVDVWIPELKTNCIYALTFVHGFRIKE